MGLGWSKETWYRGYVRDMPQLAGVTVAITGTTSGTGLHAAKALAAKGATVYCLNRPSHRAAESHAAVAAACAGGGEVHSIDCDLADFASVCAAAGALLQRLGTRPLNALINNAGVLMLPEAATDDGFDVTIQCNHLSHFLLSALLVPVLQRAATATPFGARLVVHSAPIHATGQPYDGRYLRPLLGEGAPELGGDSFPARAARYHASKAANTVFAIALAEKLREQGSAVKVITVHPGFARTSLGGGALRQLRMTWLFSVVASILAQSPEDGCLPILAAVSDPGVSNGDYYTPGQWGFMSWVMKTGVRGPPEKAAFDKGLLDDVESQATVWRASEVAVGRPFLEAGGDVEESVLTHASMPGISGEVRRRAG